MENIKSLITQKKEEEHKKRKEVLEAEYVVYCERYCEHPNMEGWKFFQKDKNFIAKNYNLRKVIYNELELSKIEGSSTFSPIIKLLERTCNYLYDKPQNIAEHLDDILENYMPYINSKLEEERAFHCSELTPTIRRFYLLLDCWYNENGSTNVAINILNKTWAKDFWYRHYKHSLREIFLKMEESI